MSRRGALPGGIMQKRKKVNEKIIYSQSENKQKTKPLTKKHLDKLDEANARDYLSDEGEQCANILLNVIYEAHKQAYYPPKKPA